MAVILIVALVALLLAVVLIFFVFSGGKKTQQKSQEELAQDAMPLADIRGHFAFMKDGSYNGYVFWPGRNQSISTDEERMAQAFKDASIISSIEVPFSVLKYPERINTNHQLNLVDDAISRENQEYFGAESDEERNIHRLKLKWLEGYIRESALNESLSHERVAYPSYVVFHFDKTYSMQRANQMMDNVIRLAQDLVDEPPRYLKEKDIRHLFQLYFTPDTVSDDAAPTGTIIQPDYGLSN